MDIKVLKHSLEESLQARLVLPNIHSLLLYIKNIGSKTSGKRSDFKVMLYLLLVKNETSNHIAELRPFSFQFQFKVLKFR